jgi:hypothetical protein
MRSAIVAWPTRRRPGASTSFWPPRCSATSLRPGPALTARWKTAIVGLAPPVLRELARRLQALEAVTNETNRELKASHLAAGEGRESAEHLLDRALASMEHIREIAEEMMRLDELLKGLAC